MAGHLSGDPSQDAFTHWLHSNYVSREDLDRRLGAMAADLTENVMKITHWLHSNYVSREDLDRRLGAMAADLTENVMKMIKSSEEAQIAAAVAAARATQEEQAGVQQVVVAGNGSGIGAYTDSESDLLSITFKVNH